MLVNFFQDLEAKEPVFRCTSQCRFGGCSVLMVGSEAVEEKNQSINFTLTLTTTQQQPIGRLLNQENKGQE